MENKNNSTQKSQILLGDAMSATMFWFNECFIFRNVQELESSLDEVKKAVFGESKVKDNEHGIEIIKERIQELHR